MPALVTDGSGIICSMSVSKTPVPLIVPMPIVPATTPVATTADTIPMTNIPTFGMCESPVNAEVIVATVAAEVPNARARAVRAGHGRPVDARVRSCPDRRTPVRAHHLDLPVQVRWDDTVVAPEQELGMGT